MKNQLLCGASKGNITPYENELSGLRGLQDREFGGILDDIFVRVIVIQSGNNMVMFVAFELDKAPYPIEYISKLSAVTGVPEDNIFMLAVHTHTAPILGDRVDDGPNNIAGKPQIVKEITHVYERRVEEIVLHTALKALDLMKPVRAGYGFGKSAINVNRNQCYEYYENGVNHKKYALGSTEELNNEDRNCNVVKFDDYNGNTVAVIVNYPVHCCVMHTNSCCNGKLGITGDIAGKTSKYIEDCYSGCVAMWTSGAAGNINPFIQDELYYADPESGKPVCKHVEGDTREILNLVASKHYQDVSKILKRIKCSDEQPSFHCKVVMIRTPGLKGDYEVRLHMMLWNDTAVIAASGELYSSYRRVAEKVLPTCNVVMINHDASLCVNSGYIFDEEMFLMPDADVPGLSHTNMKPGYFRGLFVRDLREVYSFLKAEQASESKQENQ